MIEEVFGFRVGCCFVRDEGMGRGWRGRLGREVVFCGIEGKFSREWC